MGGRGRGLLQVVGMDGFKSSTLMHEAQLAEDHATDVTHRQPADGADEPTPQSWRSRES